MNETERRERRGSPRSLAEPRALSTVSRVGSAALQNSREGLQRHERSVAAVAASILLAIGVVGARFPRALAWPLAALLGLVGATGLLHAVRPATDGPQGSEPGAGEDR